MIDCMYNRAHIAQVNTHAQSTALKVLQDERFRFPEGQGMPYHHSLHRGSSASV